MYCAKSHSVGGTFSSLPLRGPGRPRGLLICARCQVPGTAAEGVPCPGDFSHWQGSVFPDCSESGDVYSQFPFMSKISSKNGE